MTHRIAVSSAEFIRNIGYWQTEALRQPVAITHHGRERLVLAAPDAFQCDSDRGEHSERALVEARSLYAALFENLDEGFIAVDAQLRIVTTNLIAATFVGRDREHLHGASIVDVMPSPLGAVLVDRLQRVMRGGKREDIEAGSFDGRQLRMRVFPQAGGAAVLFNNVTELHDLRRALERSEALDAAVRRHVRAAAIRLDGRARVEALDSAFCVWSGFGAEDVMGHRFIDLVSPPQRRAAGELIERVLREGVTAEIGLILLGKRGEEMPGVLTLAPILTDMVAHGAQALLIPGAYAGEQQHAA